MRKLIFFLLLIFLGEGIFVKGQDTLLPLRSNPVIFQSTADASLQAKKNQTNNFLSLSLPFFDDFAKQSTRPDLNKWLPGSSVYLNKSYPRAPFTIGVATFDGLNSFGYPYNISAGINSSAGADTLTSRPINLSFLNASDSSVYLSFFYQARGWGDAPETADSLVLEFYRSSDTTWNSAWAKAGFNPGVNDSSWRYVMVKVPGISGYFTNDFQFRFRNRATLCGALDHWHLDYVLLNAGRNKSDSSFKDIAFGYQAPSLLRSYSSMPYWQFVSGGDVVSSYPVFIRNNDTTTSASNFAVKLEVFDTLNNPVLPQVSPGNFNIDNWTIGGWDDYPSHANQVINVPVPSNMTDSGTFRTRLTIQPNDFNLDENWNDTLLGETHFYNYYSFDDGTAEAGYGLNQYGSKMAVKISLNKYDSLKAVDIYFAPVVSVPLIMNSSYVIWVWNDNNGLPGDSVYADTIRYPEYLSNQFQNAFQRDTLLQAVALNPGTYYIGFQQSGNIPLNVGFDRNYNHRDRMFYNTNGTWVNSSFDGSYMIRPVFKKLDLGSGVQEIKNSSNGFTVFPNPSNENITIACNSQLNGNEFEMSLYDVSGRKVYQQRFRDHEKISTSTLSEGMYILKVNSSSEGVFTTTVIISK
jgi:Secretion system C-terminal sorting domain